MTLSEFADLAEVVSALGVVAGLVFVGVQLRQATLQMRRAERNATNTEASVARQSIVMSGEVAEIVTAALSDSRPLSEVERNRLTVFFWEVGFQIIQFWDRTRYGLFSPEEFARGVLLYQPYLTCAPGQRWWISARSAIEPALVAELERLIPELKSP